jgi:hypothetical protein
VTLKGPNAGIAGDSDERGSEAIITGGSADTPGLRVANDRVTVDGLQIENPGQDGVRFGPDTVPSEATIQNNIITNIDGNTFAGDLAAGNGIQFQFANGPPNGETANNIRILNNGINDVSTPDNSGELTATGINVLPRGNDIDGLEIDGNTISKIEPGTSGSDAAEARGVIVDTQKDDPDRDSASANAAGAVSGLSINENEFTNLAGDDVTVIALFEDFRISPRVGPENFTITNNEISNLDGTSEAAVFIGGYETLGVDHEVSQNVFKDGTVVRFSGDQSGFDPATADALNTTGNTFTDTGTVNYYSDPSTGSDLNTVFSENTFQPDVVVGDAVIREAPSDGTVLNVDKATSVNNIQPAIDDADPGDSIVVGSGSFNNNLTFGTDNLTLGGVSGKTTVNGGIEIPASDVEINGLEINLQNGVDIYAGGGGIGLDFRNNNVLVSNSSNYGLRVEGPTNPGGIDPETGAIIAGNKFTQTGVSGEGSPQAILLSDGSGFTVRNNDLKGPGSGQAVLIAKQKDSTSQNIVVENNRIDGWEEGVFLFDDDIGSIQSVTTSGNTFLNITNTNIRSSPNQ